MKYLLLVAVVLAIVWLLRTSGRPGRRNEAKERTDAAGPGPDALAPPEDMVRCEVCSVHLPRAEALTGRQGQLYCSTAHRLLGEQ